MTVQGDRKDSFSLEFVVSWVWKIRCRVESPRPVFTYIPSCKVNRDVHSDAFHTWELLANASGAAEAADRKAITTLSRSSDTGSQNSTSLGHIWKEGFRDSLNGKWPYEEICHHLKTLRSEFSEQVQAPDSWGERWPTVETPRFGV